MDDSARCEITWDESYDSLDEQHSDGDRGSQTCRKEINKTEEDIKEVVFEKHASKSFKLLKELRDAGELLDLALKVSSDSGREVILAHSCVLASHSPFIRAFLRNENKHKEVDLLNWNAETIKALVDWMYEGVLNIQPTNCYELFESSDYLCLNEVTTKCISYIYNSLTLDNCYEAYVFSCHHQTDLKNKISDYVLRNFSELLKENHLTLLPKEYFMSFLENDNLMLVNEFGFPVLPQEEEIILLKLLKNYIDQNNLHDMWPDILKRVIRFGVINKTELKPFLKEMSIWFENCKEKKECLQFLRDIKKQVIDKKPIFHISEHWGKYRKTLQNVRYSQTHPVATSSAFHGDGIEFDDVALILKELGERGEPPLLFVTGMKLYTNVWYNHLVISTIEVTYNTGTTILHGEVRNGLTPQQFDLNKGERIVSIEGHAGYLVDRLSFKTNLGTKFGPFGGEGGGVRNFRPKHPNSYLVGLIGSVAENDGFSYIRNVRFAWAYFKIK